MCKPPEDLEWETALRDGLRRLSPTAVSPDFDTRVLSALAHPVPWWRRLGREARPVLAGMACSLVVMSAAVYWSVQTPAPSLQPHPAASSAASHSSLRPLDMAALDRLLDRPNLSASALTAMMAASEAKQIPRPDGPRSPAPPKRRVSRLTVTNLV